MAYLGEIIENKNGTYDLCMFPDNKTFKTKKEAENYLRQFFVAPGYHEINFDELFSRR